MTKEDVSTIYGKALNDIYRRVASNELGSKYEAPQDVMNIIETAVEKVTKEMEND